MGEPTERNQRDETKAALETDIAGAPGGTLPVAGTGALGGTLPVAGAGGPGGTPPTPEAEAKLTALKERIRAKKEQSCWSRFPVAISGVSLLVFLGITHSERWYLNSVPDANFKTNALVLGVAAVAFLGSLLLAWSLHRDHD